MLLANDHHLDVDQTLSPLAWAGWQLQMPSEWRPLKMHGTAEKGWMMVGDAVCAMFSIHWEKPDARTARSGHEWVDQRFERLGLQPDLYPPAAAHFTACGWSCGVQTEEDKQTAYWYGYSQPAELVLGVKVNGVLPESVLELIIEQVLPSLRAPALSEGTTWSMHEVSFVSPPGFQLAQRHLYMGDVALELHRGRGETLMLRQVYPAELALKRRPFERWLASYPFKEHRKLRKSSTMVESWKPAKPEGLVGLKREGRKRLGFPLGSVAPRWTHALAVHDQELDRLLIAERVVSSETDASVCETAITNMNLPLRGGR